MCAVRGLKTNGCMAVSVTKADGVMFCNLATQFSAENDIVDDGSSERFVLGESLKSWETDLLKLYLTGKKIQHFSQICCC